MHSIVKASGFGVTLFLSSLTPFFPDIFASAETVCTTDQMTWKLFFCDVFCQTHFNLGHESIFDGTFIWRIKSKALLEIKATRTCHVTKSSAQKEQIILPNSMQHNCQMRRIAIKVLHVVTHLYLLSKKKPYWNQVKFTCFMIGSIEVNWFCRLFLKLWWINTRKSHEFRCKHVIWSNST